MKRQLLILDDGVVLDAIVGYRAWEAWAVDGVVHLTSVTRREVEWTRGEAMRSHCRCNRLIVKPARVLIGDEEFMARSGDITIETGTHHTCGIYAWDNPIIPYSQRMLGQCEYYFTTYVVGEVLLWGKVRVHERGYRAEYAKPSAFYVADAMVHRQRTIVELAALQWCVPTVRVEQHDHAVERFEQAVEHGHLYP